MIEPLSREHPGDGGGRWLEAECDSLEGAALTYSIRITPGIAALRRARAGFEALVRDNPPYTLPTDADGPTVYRRSLAQVLHWIGVNLDDLGDFAGALEAVRQEKEVLAALVSGPFASDSDRRNLVLADRMIGRMHNTFGRHAEATLFQRRAVAAARQLVDANPTSAEYRADLALGLQGLADAFMSTNHASARRCALEALAILRSLPTAQRDRYELVKVEYSCGLVLGGCAAAEGRTDEALRHVRRSVAVCEEAGRAHPDSPFFVTNFLADSLLNLTMVELSAGHPVEAMRAAERLGEVAETSLRTYPELYEQRAFLINSLLIRALILLQSGRAPDASRAAEQAAERLDDGRAGSPGWERFCHGAVHGFFYALGRPKGPGHPAEPPGLKEHADRAIAEAREADRLGYRSPQTMAMLNQLIGRPPAMQLLLMDQLFPFDPFQPEPVSEDDEPVSDARGPKP